MSEFVNFVCPKHGFVCAINPVSRVACGRCGGAEVAPEGLTVAQHLRNYRAALRMRRMRNKRAA